MSVSAAPRTLADQFRNWPDEELVHLLAARPDLSLPAPQDSSQLASRASTRASVLQAVDQLNMLELTVLDAIVALGGTTSLGSLAAHVNAANKSVVDAVGRLRSLALLWGADGQLRAVSVLSEIVGTALSRLGPSAETLLMTYGPNRLAVLAKDLGIPVTGERQTDIVAVAGFLSDHGNVTTLVDELDPQARKILEHLEHESAEGTVTSTEKSVTRKSAEGPVDQLLARGLLIARDRKHVAVPREVAIFIRGGRTTRSSADQPPALTTSERDQVRVDKAAAGAAFEFVRHVELLLEHWGNQPPAALRGGGLGVRELRATAEMLHLDEGSAALHIETASAAGLLAVGQNHNHAAAWLPTDAFDFWVSLPVADQWARLALAWLDNPRLTALIGTRDSGKPVNTLVPELERGWLPEARRTALEQVAGLAEGQVLAAGTGVASLVQRLQWLQPRRPAIRAEAIGWAVSEAAVIGLMALGGVAVHGRAALQEKDTRTVAAKALDPLLPVPIDHVLLQADLTAVAPGPLEPHLAHRLAMLADIESRGGATVYRFNASSVRRAFDSGWSAGEIQEFLATSSRTPVPQPLAYLIDDVSRRFGTVRVGAAESFLRSDDESALSELVHNPKAASLRLRKIAPTVVVSDVPLDVLLPRLHELGTAPVVESADGTVQVARREARRARSPREREAAVDNGSPRRALDSRTAARVSARAQATATAIRAGDNAASLRPPRDPDGSDGSGGPVRHTPMSTMAMLREAVEAKQSVWIGYVDNHGSTVERVVDPVRVEGGWLNAFDHRSEEIKAFAVHRITAVKTVAAS